MSLVEKCWMVTSKISVIALLMITGIYFGKFVCPYIKKKKGAVAVSIVYITIMLVLYMIPPQIDNFSAYLIGVIAAFLAMYVEDRRNIYQKIFLAITFFSIRWLTVAMAGRLDDLVTKALVFRNMSAEKVWLQYGLYVGTRVLDIVLCIAFIAVAIGLINKAYIYKKDEMSVKEMVMLIIPSLVGVTGYGILQYYLMIYERDTGKNLIDTYGFYGALSFLHYLISIVAILVVIVMFQNWKEMQEEQRGQELVLNQISDMKKHIEEVEKLYRDIRSMRHDMGNHIQTLEHLVAHNNMDDATEYLEHLKNEWDEVSPEIKTGSPVIDVILMEKLREAKERQIRFMKAYYAKQDAEKLSGKGDTSQKLTLMKTSADSLKKSADALNDSSLWEKKKIKKKDEKTGEEIEVEDYDWDKITKAVKSFVEDYNDVVKEAGESNTKDVLRNASWMTGMTDKNSNMLAKIGITIGKGNKLELDEDALRQADISSLKTIFTGYNSFVSKISQKATGISNAANRASATYTNNGTYSKTDSLLTSSKIDEEV